MKCVIARPDPTIGRVQRLAGAFEIARGTLVPHPYEDGMAEAWIASQANDYEAGKLVNFAAA